MRTCDDSLTKIKPRAIIENYLTQSLPKETSNRRSTNGTQFKETKYSIQLLSRGTNYHEKVTRQQPLGDSTAPYDYYTTTNNTHDKYETMKHANMLTILWLHCMCKNWYLILMVLFTCNWYLPQWNSSSNDIQFINTSLQQNNYTSFNDRL
jgi:hypothetical protein